jgi:hypothetical protein
MKTCLERNTLAVSIFRNWTSEFGFGEELIIPACPVTTIKRQDLFLGTKVVPRAIVLIFKDDFFFLKEDYDAIKPTN